MAQRVSVGYFLDLGSRGGLTMSCPSAAAAGFERFCTDGLWRRLFELLVRC